jgi:hypothetical protein
MIRHRHAIDTKYRDTQGPAFERDAVDIGGSVLIHARGELVQIRGEPLGLDPADEDFRETGMGFWVWPARYAESRIVDREGRLIEIALELEAGFLDELLVFGVVGNWRKFSDRLQRAEPFQINVEEPIRSREKASRFGRRTAAQLDNGHQGCGDQQNRYR